MLPHLDGAEIPLPSALFQFAWENREALVRDELILDEGEWISEKWTEKDGDWVILYDNFDAMVKTKKTDDGYIFSGITSGGHEYCVLTKKDKVIIFINDEEKSDYFIPLLLTLNEYAEDFEMKKAYIIGDTEKYSLLLYDDLFEHFANSPRHHRTYICSEPIKDMYHDIQEKYSHGPINIPGTGKLGVNFYPITVPGTGSLGGYLAGIPQGCFYNIYDLVIGR